MPYLKVVTNQKVEDCEGFLKASSSWMAELLRKPERYVMVELTAEADLLFAGSREPAAYVEFKSIGLPDPASLSAEVCRFIEEKLGIAADRIYIEFIDIPRGKWGWNRSVF